MAASSNTALYHFNLGQRGAIRKLRILENVQEMLFLFESRPHSASDIAMIRGISKNAAYRYMQELRSLGVISWVYDFLPDKGCYRLSNKCFKTQAWEQGEISRQTVLDYFSTWVYRRS